MPGSGRWCVLENDGHRAVHQPRARRSRSRGLPTCAPATSTATATSISRSPVRLRRWRDALDGEPGRLAIQRARAAESLRADQRRRSRIWIATAISTSSSLVSQEWEEIYAFVNDGRGHFDADASIWGSTNDDFGSSWLTRRRSRQGRRSSTFLYSNGDAFDYAPPSGRPWHGVQWLENTGSAEVRASTASPISPARRARRRPISTATAISTSSW